MEYLVLSTCNCRPVLIYSPYADTKVLFAIASLLHSEDSLPVAMIQKGGATFNPLHGTLISFCSKINRPTAEDPSVYETVSAFVWPDLSVRHEGLYRLRFHVYEVEDGDVILRGVDISNTLRVYAAKEFPGMADSTPFTELLKNHGLRVRVAKSSRAKRKILHHIRGESSMHHEEQSIYNSMDSEYGGYDINLSTRQSTPEEEDPQESMVSRSFLFANNQDVDDMPGMVPPGNVLPVPLHSSPLMSNHNGNRFPENQQTQSLFQSSHPGFHPSLNYLITSYFRLLPTVYHSKFLAKSRALAFDLSDSFAASRRSAAIHALGACTGEPGRVSSGTPQWYGIHRPHLLSASEQPTGLSGQRTLVIIIM